jgi:predicted dehydrogenase
MIKYRNNSLYEEAYTMPSSPNGPNRRKFITTVTAAAAPYVITSSALGAADRAPANDRITMGMIGVGGRGSQVHELFLKDSRIQCLAVCDVDTRRCGQAKARVDAKHGNRDCIEYGDFRRLLDRADVDVAVIATPDHWHVPIAVRACRQGKDVYCEKPLSLTIREARAAVTVARRYERVFQVGTQNRSNPAARAGCEFVRNGRLGELRFVEVGTWHASRPCNFPAQPVPAHLDWDMFLGPAPWRPYHAALHRPKGWIPFRDFSGGGTTDVGAHLFDLAQLGLGTEDTYPVEVVPLDPRKNRGRRVEFRYADGRVMYRRTPGNDVKFVGELGTIDMVTCAWVTVSYTQQELALESRGLEKIHGYFNHNHAANFLDCVRTRRKPVADVELGCRAAVICHMGNIAQWLGRPLKWDPAEEEFVGDEEANLWLDRAKREPWTI